MRSPIRAEEVLEILYGIGLKAPILEPTDVRWLRLRVPPESAVDLHDRLRGALIGGAIGDALGRANEGRPTSEAPVRKVRDFQPWHGWQSGPKGTITDDTQMSMWLAEAIVGASREPRAVSRDKEWEEQESEDSGQQEQEQSSERLSDYLIDPDDLAKRFTREPIRGIGQATREFVHNYKDLGKPWYEAGVRSAGNGTAMRAAPVGLVHLGDPYRIYRDSLLQSVVTHRDSMAIAAAACQAYATARAADPAAERSLTDGSIGGRSNRVAAWILLLDTPSGR